MILHKLILPGILACGALTLPLAASFLPPSTPSQSLPPIHIANPPDIVPTPSVDDLNYLEWLRRLRCDRFITQQTIDQCQAAATRYNEYELGHRRKEP